MEYSLILSQFKYDLERLIGRGMVVQLIQTIYFLSNMKYSWIIFQPKFELERKVGRDIVGQLMQIIDSSEIWNNLE